MPSRTVSEAIITRLLFMPKAESLRIGMIYFITADKRK